MSGAGLVVTEKIVRRRLHTYTALDIDMQVGLEWYEPLIYSKIRGMSLQLLNIV